MHGWELDKDTLDMTRLGLSNNKLLSLRSCATPVCPKGMPISHPRLPDKQDPRPPAGGDSIPPHLLRERQKFSIQDKYRMF